MFCQYQDGDFVYSPETKLIRNIFYLASITDTEVKVALSPLAKGWEGDKKYIWLPRQDQLQEMVRDLFPVSWVLAKEFAEKAYHLSADTNMSMEQLWLAFVMKEEFGKVWTGEEWR